MSKNRLENWLAERAPQVPTPFLPHLLEGWEGPVDPGRLADGGLETLARALRIPGRDRRGAFDLLVADALLTYACEAMAGERDVEGGLEDIFRRVATRFSP